MRAVVEWIADNYTWDENPGFREAAKEQRKLEKELHKTQRETARQRKKRLARVDKERQEGEDLLREITRAFDWQLVGEEVVDSSATHVISAEPKQGYVPASREARVLTKLRATLWVAQDDYGWVKADIETTNGVIHVIDSVLLPN